MFSSAAIARELCRTGTSPTLQPEIALVIACAHRQLSAAQVTHVQDCLKSDLDWQWVLHQARKHGVVPLLHKSLTEIGGDRVPAEVLQQLLQHQRRNTLKNLQFTRELIRVLDTLQAAGIAAIPFKGPVLAIAAYGDLNLRSFSDLDLLVPADDYLKIHAVLAPLGYQVAVQRWQFSPQETEADWEEQGEYSLIQPELQVSLDIHQRLIAGFLFKLSASFDDFWTRLAPISLCGREIPTFRPEDLLIYLCVHGTKDFWQRLSWICDVSALIHRHPHLDWESVLQEAKKHGASRMLLLGLALAHKILGTALPFDIQQEISATTGLDGLVVYVSQRIYHDDPERPTGLRLHQAQYHMQSMDRWRDRVYHGLQLIQQWTVIPLVKCVKPTAKDRQFCPLPSGLYPLYYVLRPIRIVKAAISSGASNASPASNASTLPPQI